MLPDDDRRDSRTNHPSPLLNTPAERLISYPVITSMGNSRLVVPTGASTSTGDSWRWSNSATDSVEVRVRVKIKSKERGQDWAHNSQRLLHCGSTEKTARRMPRR